MWSDISYLSSGTLSQQRAHQCLSTLEIFLTLARYSPTLVSTVCLDIDIESSDLDIICEVYNHDVFIKDVEQLYGHYREFSSRRSEHNPPATVIRFLTDQFEIELFGQAIPIEQQSAYRHLVQIDRVLRLGGQGMREQIRALKRQGVKTEPAVSQLLRLPGDPYQAVLDLECAGDAEIVERIRLRDTSPTSP